VGGGRGGEPSASFQFVDQAQVGVVEPAGVARPRVDGGRDGDHAGRDAGDIASRGRGEDGGAERGLGLARQDDGPSEDVGA
jgi:hypothetical protein